MKTFKRTLAIIMVVLTLVCTAPLSGFLDMDWADFFGVTAEAAGSNALSCGKVAKHKTEVPAGYVGIWSGDDMRSIRDNPSKKYILMQDIDMTYTQWTPPAFQGTFDGNGYTIQGLHTSDVYSDSYINRSSGLFGALFGATVKNLTLKDVYIEPKASYGSSMIGGLAGWVERSTIQNCSVTGVLDSSWSAGGLVGVTSYKNGSSNISNCYANVTIRNAPYAGGLIGGSNYTNMSKCYAITDFQNCRNPFGVTNSANNCNFSDCYYYGAGFLSAFNSFSSSTAENVTKTTKDAILSGNTPVKKSVPKGYVGVWSGDDMRSIRDNPSKKYILMQDIDMTYTQWTPPAFQGTFDGNGYTIQGLHTSDVYSDSYINRSSGLFGALFGATVKNLTLKDVYIEPKASYGSSMIGGLAGWVERSTIQNCSVTGVLDSSWSAGGLVGVTSYKNGSSNISNCYANVTIRNAPYAGGLIGGSNYTNMSKCYAITDFQNCRNPFGVTNSANNCNFSDCYYYRSSLVAFDSFSNSTSQRVMGRSKAQMAQKSTYMNFDFKNIWKLDNDMYPTLRTEKFTYSASDYYLNVVEKNSQMGIDSATVKIGDTMFTTTPTGGLRITAAQMKNATGGSISSSTVEVLKNDDYTHLTLSTGELKKGVVTTIELEAITSDRWGVQELLRNLVIEEDQTITGPTIELFGKEYPFFSLEGGLKIGQFSTSVKENTKDKTFKVMVGINTKGLDLSSDTTGANTINKDGEDKNSWDYWYKQIKDYYGAKTAEKRAGFYQNLHERAIASEGKLGFKANVEITGYMQFDYSTGKLVLQEGGIMLTFNGSASATSPICATPPIYVKFTIGGEIGGKVYLHCVDAGYLDIAGNISGKFKPSAGVGLGSDKIASVEVGIDGEIKASLDFPYLSFDDSFELSLSAQLYLRAHILTLEKKWKTNYPKYVLLPWSKHGFDSSKKAPAKAKAAPAVEIGWDDFELISRDYLEGKSTIRKAPAKAKSLAANLNENSVYPYGSPQLIAQDNGNVVALWVYDDGTKAETANCTTLYYSVYDGTGWTTPAAVFESCRADMNAVLATDGTTVYALWQRSSEVLTDDIMPTDMLSKTELVCAAFDGESWTEPTVVDPAGTYQSLFDITAKDGTVTVAWAENDADDLTFSGETTIYRKTLSENVWSDAEAVDTKAGISALAVGAVNGVDVVAYSVDKDGDFATNGDSELFMNGVAVTDDDVDDLNVSFQNGTFYWLKSGELYAYENEQATATGVQAEQDYAVASNGTQTAVVTKQTDGLKSELVMQTIGGSGTATLSNYGKHISSFDAVMLANGSIMALSDVDNLSDDENSYPYTTTDMRSDIFGDLVDLVIGEQVYYDPAAVIPEQEIGFTANITNNSMMAIPVYTLKLMDGSTVLATQEVTDSIQSGETKEVTFNYSLPQTITRKTLTLTVSVADDYNAANDSTSFDYGFADVAINNATIAEDGTVTATITNKGYEMAENVVLTLDKLIDDFTTIHTVQIGSLTPGASYAFSYGLGAQYTQIHDETTINHFVLNVATDTEEVFVSNNMYDLWKNPQRVESLTLSKDALLMDIGQTQTLTAEILPADAYNQNLIWITSDANVATVDAQGKVTAVSGGIATISVVSEDGAKTATCAVSVNEVYHTVTYIVDEAVYEEFSIAVGHQVFRPDNPTKTGYTFTGWDAEIPMYMGNENLTFTAEWTINTYDAVFDANGGTYADETTSITVPTAYGAVPAAPDAPTLEGKVFIGWSPVVAAIGAVNVTYLAQWADEDATLYTVTFLADGETVAEVKYIAGAATINEPPVPAKQCQIGAWEEYALAGEDLTVNAVYTEHHTPVIDEATEPTCTEPGFTEGSHCSVCGLVFTAQETIPALGHTEPDEDGCCERCGVYLLNDHTPGDINGDGVLNNKDLNRLMKYLAGDDVEVVEAALDLNGDGNVNNKDLNRLMKYLAGEDVEIF